MVGSRDGPVVKTQTSCQSSTRPPTGAHNLPVGSLPVGVIVSSDGSRIYVANSGSNTVSVIDTATNATVATVAVGSNPVDLAVSLDGSRVYVADLGSNDLSVSGTQAGSHLAPSLTAGTEHGTRRRRGVSSTARPARRNEAPERVRGLAEPAAPLP